MSQNYNCVAPEPFNFSNPGDWPKWIRRFERFRQASGLINNPENEQVNMLVYCMGDNADDIFVVIDQLENYGKVIECFESHFIPRRNIIYERARFNQRCQQEGEKVNEFITALHSLAEHCNFGMLHDELIRDRIVVGVLYSPTAVGTSVAAAVDREIRLHSVQQDFALDLPATVRMPDGEGHLPPSTRSYHPDMQRPFIRPPPNRTVHCITPTKQARTSPPATPLVIKSPSIGLGSAKAELLDTLIRLSEFKKEDRYCKSIQPPPIKSIDPMLSRRLTSSVLRSSTMARDIFRCFLQPWWVPPDRHSIQEAPVVRIGSWSRGTEAKSGKSTPGLPYTLSPSPSLYMPSPPFM
ncbi:hypothetical protein LAZ67_21002324 [Cordylochernes scorpioides]|uniref:Retrotransposon gag domain-containing protein n=1 Tax=Cordylochernes scorpioides TaxID=51811 RepID=A0ABY6LQ87_9ARAC|nr:hypothetical protein LAZ67_21002324 [Cordylochernes scorpioides]